MKKVSILVALVLLVACHSLPQEDVIPQDPKEPDTTGVIPVTRVELDRTALTFNEIGDTFRLHVRVFPENATDKRIKWSGGGKTYSLDSTGLVTAKGNGSGVITVTSIDQGKKATCSVKVAQRVTGVVLSHNYLRIQVGTRITLQATVSPDNAANAKCSWSSDNEDVVSVTTYDYYSDPPTAFLEGLSAGKSMVRAASVSDKDVTDECEVEVFSPMKIEVVDMGLSVGWANANLGSTAIEDIGDYFAWGETSTQYYTLTPPIWKFPSYYWLYDWDTYQLGRNPLALNKYNTKERNGTVDNLTVLELEDDAAHAILGEKWRMPTDAEWEELFENSTLTWISDDNRKGCLVTSTINGNSLFFPYTGYYSQIVFQGNTETINTYAEDSQNGYYWSSCLGENNPDPYCAYVAIFSSSNYLPYTYLDRCYGCVIRPVMQH